ncbi:ERF superfamily protein [Pseudomonas phage vB_PaeM_USP_18]|nr:ERF superfamily protein [Pseudomonas phage vB_PaeM_USP_18]
MQDQSDAIAQLYTALSKAQGEFTPIKKDRDGQTGNQKFKYADFDQLITATRPHLVANGLAVVQLINSGADGASSIETRLIHQSGASIGSTMVIARANYDRVQDYGKLITYLRRYAYSALLCLAADDDEDDIKPPQGANGGDQGTGGQRTAISGQGQGAENNELPIYPQELFDKNLEARRKGVAEGKTTPENIISMIESKARLTDEQRKVLLALEGPQQ